MGLTLSQGSGYTGSMTTEKNTPAPFIVRATTSGRSAFTKFLVYRAGRRVSVHAFNTRESAQASADQLNIGAMVKDHAEDPRPYAVKLEEARAAYAASPAPGYCAGCGQTFNGARGLKSHQSQRFLTNACRGN